MTEGARIVTVPRNDLVNGYTMAEIIQSAGLTIPRFKKLL
jgi:hypothetical protein